MDWWDMNTMIFQGLLISDEELEESHWTKFDVCSLYLFERSRICHAVAPSSLNIYRSYLYCSLVDYIVNIVYMVHCVARSFIYI